MPTKHANELLSSLIDMADDQIVATKLPPVSSSSSLPSLASSRPSSASISELDTIPNEAQTIPIQTTQGERMNPNTNNNNSGTNMQQQQQYKKRPFQSLTKLSTNGPFQKLQFHIVTALSIICCLLSSTVSATTIATNTNTQYQYHLRRHLEDNNSGDNENDGWTGEWNGEWTATDDMSFVCDDDGGCIQTKPSGNSDSGSSNSMWYDNGDLLTPEQIITYVSLGALTFMTLLCCLCYPEIITVGCNKCLGRSTRNVDEDIEGGGDYVGGKIEDEGKKKKKSRRSRSSSKTRSSSRSRSGRSSSRSRSSKKNSDKDVEMTETKTQLV